MDPTKRVFFLVAVLMSGAALLTCSPEKRKPIDYLGQSPPDSTATLFAPGIISTDDYEHSAPAFSPDGSVVLWTRVNKSYRGSMLEMSYDNGKWSAPHRASFADSTADDYYPSFSPDGKTLYFSSRRNLPAGYPPVGDMRIWKVDRLAHGWAAPVPVDTAVSRGNEYAHSISANGTLVFSGPMGKMNFNIRQAEIAVDKYSAPAVLPYSINSVGYEDGPYISPDESFLIFESQRPEGIDGSIDLYISFRNNKDWTVPVNMGPKINSGASERFARLSPDGKYLFFGSARNQSSTNRGFDIFWIDAGIIDELRVRETLNKVIDGPLGTDIVNSLVAGDAPGSSGLFHTWLKSHPASLDATVIYSSLLRKQNLFLEADSLLARSPQWKNDPAIVMETALINFGLGKDSEAENTLVTILRGDQHRERLLTVSNALLDLRKFTMSDLYFEKAMAMGAGAFPYYRRAGALAVAGEKDRSFVALNKAADLGYTNLTDYMKNPDLATLRSDSQWERLVKKLK